MRRDVPAYLEAPDNEDSEGTCTHCGEDAYDDGRYPDLCFDCNEEALIEEYWERKAEERWEREMDDDWRYDD